MNEKTRPTPRAILEAQQAASRERDRLFAAQMKEKARITAAAAEAQDAEQARQQALQQEADFRETELARYVAAGGTESDFVQRWPALRLQLVEKRYLESAVADSTKTVAERTLRTHYGAPPVAPARRQETPHLTAEERNG